MLAEERFRHPTGKLTGRCHDCLATVRRLQRAARERRGPAATRAAHLWEKYRITIEQYDALREAQQYRCGICRTPEDELPAPRSGRPRLDGKPSAEPVRLVVDHCHQRRAVRGLLCVGCNSMLGQARDRPEILRAGAEYLETAAAEISGGSF